MFSTFEDHLLNEMTSHAEQSRFSYAIQTEEFRNLNTNLENYLNNIQLIDEENLQLQKHIDEIRTNYISTLENHLKRLPEDFRQESQILTDAHIERYKSKSRAKRFLHEREELKKRIHFIATNDKHQFKQFNQLQKHEQNIRNDFQSLNRQLQYVYTYVENEKQLHQQAMDKVDRLQIQLEQTCIERSKTEFEIQTLREEVQLMQTVKEFLGEEHQSILLTQTEANDYLLSRLNESIAHIREDFNQLNQNQLKQIENEYKQMIDLLEENTTIDETIRNQQRTKQIEYEQLKDEYQILDNELLTLNKHNEILSERILSMENDLYKIRDERTRELMIKDNELERNQIELQSLNEKLNYLIEYDRNLKFELTLYRGVLESEYRRKQQQQQPQLNVNNQQPVRPTTLQTMTTKSNRNTSKNSTNQQQLTPMNEKINNQTNESLSTSTHFNSVQEQVQVLQSTFTTDSEATLFSNSPSIQEFSIPLNEYLITSETPHDGTSPTNTSAEGNQFTSNSSEVEKVEELQLLNEELLLSSTPQPLATTEEKQEPSDTSTAFEEQSESANTNDDQQEPLVAEITSEEKKEESIDIEPVSDDRVISSTAVSSNDQQQLSTVSAAPEDLTETFDLPVSTEDQREPVAVTDVQETQQETANNTEESENQPQLSDSNASEEQQESVTTQVASEIKEEPSDTHVDVVEEQESNISSEISPEQQDTSATQVASEEEEEGEASTDTSIDTIKQKGYTNIVAFEDQQEPVLTTTAVSEEQSDEHQEISRSDIPDDGDRSELRDEQEFSTISNVPEDQSDSSTLAGDKKQQESETDERPTSPIYIDDTEKDQVESLNKSSYENESTLSDVEREQSELLENQEDSLSNVNMEDQSSFTHTNEEENQMLETKEELISSSNQNSDEQSKSTGFLSSAGYYGTLSNVTHYVNQGLSKASSHKTSLTDIEIDNTDVVGEAGSCASPKIEENENANVVLEYVMNDLRYVYRSLVNEEDTIEINEDFAENLIDRLEFKDTLIQTLFNRLLHKYIIEPAKSETHSKTLDWIEFRDILFPILTCRYTEGHIRKLFNLFDLNQTGYLSFEEINELLELLQIENSTEFAQQLANEVKMDELIESIRNSDAINVNLLPDELEYKSWYLRTPAEDESQPISIEVPCSEKNHAGIIILLSRIFKRVGLDIETKQLNSTKSFLSMKLTNEFIHNNIPISNDDLHSFIDLYLNRKRNSNIFINWDEFRDVFLPLVNGGLITKDDLQRWLEILDSHQTKTISDEQILHLLRLLQIPYPDQILVKIQEIYPNKNASWTYEEFLFAFKNLDETSLHLLSTNDQIIPYNIDWLTKTNI